MVMVCLYMRIISPFCVSSGLFGRPEKSGLPPFAGGLIRAQPRILVDQTLFAL